MLYLDMHLHTYLYLLNYSFDRGGTAYHFGASEFTPILSWVHNAQSLVFCAVVCRPRSFCPFSFSHYIVYPTLSYTFSLPSNIY
jgi:hypothetical protein